MRVQHPIIGVAWTTSQRGRILSTERACNLFPMQTTFYYINNRQRCVFWRHN